MDYPQQVLLGFLLETIGSYGGIERLWIQTDDSATQCESDGMGTIGNAKLGENILQVHFGGAWRGTHALPDFPITEALGSESQHLQLSLRQSYRKMSAQAFSHFRRHQPFGPHMLTRKLL